MSERTRTLLLLGAAVVLAASAGASAQTRLTQHDAVTIESETDNLARLRDQLKGKQWPEAVATFELLARDRPDVLGTVNANWLFTFNRELKEAGETALRRRFLRTILTSGYAAPDPTMSLDYLRMGYAEIQLADGDHQGAAETVRGITLRWVLMDLSVDPQFRAMLGPDFDLRAVVERDLVKYRAIMTAWPDRLSAVIEVAGILRQLGRPQESLALLEAVRARVEGDGEPWSDADDNVNWWWDSVARAHAMLGHVDQAIAAFRTGASLGESGNANVSQVINLAHLQNRAGRPRDALATLAPFAGDLEASPHGFAEMRLARGCANARIGNRAAAAADLAWLKQGAEDHSAALAGLLLCMNDVDGAAAVTIARLGDPQRRSSTLLELSDYEAPPVALPRDPLAARFARLKARPDVRAAIARAGGIRRFNVQADPP